MGIKIMLTIKESKGHTQLYTNIYAYYLHSYLFMSSLQEIYHISSKYNHIGVLWSNIISINFVKTLHLKFFAV